MTAQEESIGRAPPQSVASERGVLGSMLIEAEAIPQALAILQSEDFYREAHASIFAAMLELSERGEPIDLLTLSEELAKVGKLDTVGGVAYLTKLASETPTAAHIERYAQKVRERSAARRLIRIGTDIVARGFDPALEADEMLNEADTAIQSARNSVGTSDVERVNAVMDRQIQNVYAQGANAPQPVHFGLRIDQHFAGGKKVGVFAGFRSGDLTILGGRTSMGKTFVTLHVARECAIRMQRPVLIASLEMRPEDVTDRLFASLSGIPADMLPDRETWVNASDELTRYAIQTLDNAPIFVTNRHRTSARIKAAALALKRKAGLGLVIVDYLELVEDAIAGEKRDALGKMAQRFRNLALDLDVPVLLVHQLNRAPDARQEKRPFLSDLRDSGHLENAADAVILLYRPGYYDYDADQSELEIIVAKQRKGDVGTAKVHLDRERGILTDYGTEPIPPPDRSQGRRVAEQRGG